MKKSNPFKFIMISAMYENGGNTTQRFLDGHPNLFVYPFESQLGTSLTSDYFTSLFPVKYRWPVFSLSGNFSEDYELIIDEELKRHIKTPAASKFKSAQMDMSDKERKKIFLDLLKHKERTRGNIVEAFFISTWKAWKNYSFSGKESTYVGYSPIIGVDTEKIIEDFPNVSIIHVVRNPYSAYADTKKRAVPYSLTRYIQTWNIMQLLAINFSTMYPKNFHLVRFEDLVQNPKKFFTTLLGKIGISYSSTCEYPSWNGKRLENIVPWGTITIASSNKNKETMEELSNAEYNEIKSQTQAINKLLGYDHL